MIPTAISFDKAQYINCVASRATPLWDRDRICLSSESKIDSELYHKRLDRWIAILGSEELLAKRLKCNDLTLHDLPLILDSVKQKVTLHGWCETFSSVMSHYESHNDLTAIRNLQLPKSLQPLPFEEILIPFIQHYKKHILKVTGNKYKVFSKEARGVLEKQLLSHLSYVAGLSLGVEFYKFRFNMAPSASIESVWIKQKPSRVIYNAFVQYMLGDGMWQFFECYPVLARLLCQSVDQYILAISIFCQRFSHDFDELKKEFRWKINESQNAISRLLTNLSDRHNGGQTVFKCLLSSGESIIYKPRNVKPEITFYNFLKYINDYDLPLELKTILALDKGQYGWVETVKSTSCSTGKEVERFYVRAGAMLAILNVLSMTDVHFENLIADGEYPVIVDLETLLDKFMSQEKTRKVGKNHSILRTGFLPKWQKTIEGHQFDMSGLSADEFQDSGINVFGWRFINTDQMQLKDDKRTMVSLQHRVHTKMKFPSVLVYLHSFLEGFKQGYFCLLKNKNNLLSNDKMLCQFDGLKLRTIVRDTNTYSKIQLHLLHPEYLKDGIERSIELEWLARPLMGTESPRKSRIMLYELERKAMEQLDIPHFDTSIDWDADKANIDEDFIFFNRKRDSNILRENLEGLSIKDYNQQKKVIERLIRSRFENLKKSS